MYMYMYMYMYMHISVCLFILQNLFGPKNVKTANHASLKKKFEIGHNLTKFAIYTNILF